MTVYIQKFYRSKFSPIGVLQEHNSHRLLRTPRLMQRTVMDIRNAEISGIRILHITVFMLT